MSMTDKKVLIIDDVADQLLLARKILENVGLTVLTADSVDAAIALLQANSPHLILLDLQMPVKSGFKFLEYRRGVPELSTVPVLVTSGLQNPESVHKAITLGAADYLIKPFHAAKLLQKVRKLLKDTVFQSLEFSDDFRPDVSCTVRGEITQVTDTGFTIETPVRVAPQTQLGITGDSLDFLPAQKAFYVSGLKPSVKSSSGMYATFIGVVGLSKTLKQIKGKKS